MTLASFLGLVDRCLKSSHQINDLVEEGAGARIRSSLPSPAAFRSINSSHRVSVGVAVASRVKGRVQRGNQLLSHCLFPLVNLNIGQQIKAADLRMVDDSS